MEAADDEKFKLSLAFKELCAIDKNTLPGKFVYLFRESSQKF